METFLTKTQKTIAIVLGVLLIVVVALSTVDLGFLIARKRSQPFPKVFQETICFCLMLEF